MPHDPVFSPAARDCGGYHSGIVGTVLWGLFVATPFLIVIGSRVALFRVKQSPCFVQLIEAAALLAWVVAAIYLVHLSGRIEQMAQ
jgi:hypothetical protein